MGGSQGSRVGADMFGYLLAQSLNDRAADSSGYVCQVEDPLLRRGAEKKRQPDTSRE